jgi:SSS family solute:Na+ symporter
MSTWALLSLTPLGEVIPSVLAGLLMAGIGMVVGSLLPTAGNRSHREQRAHHHHPHRAGSRPHG